MDVSISRHITIHNSYYYVYKRIFGLVAIKGIRTYDTINNNPDAIIMIRINRVT